MIADFTFNEHQLELQRAARRFFSEAESLAKAREDEASESGYQAELWSQMTELGWLGMSLPTEIGGGGGTFLDGYALCEEMGRALVTSPYLDTFGLAAPLLAEQGGRFSDVLARIMDGNCVVSLILGDSRGRVDRADVKASRDETGWHLQGVAPLVPFASSADYFVCAAQTTSDHAAELSLFLIDATSPGISLERVENIAALPLYRVGLSDVSVAETVLIGEPGKGWNALGPALTKAAVLQTAYIVGAAHSVLEMTNQYAKDRWQFDIPIGKNQAVQYLVSDVLIDLHTADLLGRQAAYRIDVGLPYEAAAEVAIVHGKTQAASLHRRAHEVFAGVGFMMEHPLNLFSRKSKYWENNFGDARFHYEQVARLLCDERPEGAIERPLASSRG